MRRVPHAQRATVRLAAGAGDPAQPPGHLQRVAAVAKVRAAPAEPGGDRAAVPALPHHIFWPMLCTCLACVSARAAQPPHRAALTAALTAA
eukprot:CAMPEP_0202781100 /NCGR_PEP_ID=MMETSP1388-20130828/60029_1 /ASSEMBLY_ACC=CAM_ASM_000864 /TAXON_ID=37098 /ORGANISM="Isochrysis sp, Strain CCMP1244" /LENGTH=90 /DNA_ID=CAMNT_0049450499 /DNA_START=177 /DNA_END=446 /DNA_ORIENTATION=-